MSDRSFLFLFLMKALVVQIVAVMDDWQPGWVKCIFTDIYGKEWSIVEKAPVVTIDDIDANSTYPIELAIQCEILSQSINVVTINLENPWGISAEDGTAIFEVYENQIKDISN